MSRIHAQRSWLAGAAVVIAAGSALVVAPRGAHAAPRVPSLRMMASVKHLQVDRFGKQTRLYVSSGIFVTPTDGAFELDAHHNHGNPLFEQVRRSGHNVTVLRKIRHSGAHSLSRGLPGFFVTTLRNSAKKVVATSHDDFCPGSLQFDIERVSPAGPPNPTFPQSWDGCATRLTRATVWGIDNGWADGLYPQLRAPVATVPDGTYTLDVSIAPRYAHQLHVAGAADHADVTVHVVTSHGGCVGCGAARIAREQAARRAPGRVAASAATPQSTGKGGLPDLASLPAHDLVIRHTTKGGHDFLGFGATIWNRGPGTFDVEGFRHGGKPTMTARQFLYRKGHPTTSFPIGHFEFDTRPGHNHWHMADVAQYTLLSAKGKKVVRSHKQSFCLAPTDPVNLTLRHALWTPQSIGLNSSCPSDQSIWLRETLPVGWGDTYVQEVGGQAFNISSVPNGRYLIEVATNPHGRIHETTLGNNRSYLAVKLAGTPGSRTVTTIGPVAKP